MTGSHFTPNGAAGLSSSDEGEFIRCHLSPRPACCVHRILVRDPFPELSVMVLKGIFFMLICISEVMVIVLADSWSSVDDSAISDGNYHSLRTAVLTDQFRHGSGATALIHGTTAG